VSPLRLPFDKSVGDVKFSSNENSNDDLHSIAKIKIKIELIIDPLFGWQTLAGPRLEVAVDESPSLATPLPIGAEKCQRVNHHAANVFE
jgi:hypothetical protein